MPNIEHIKKYKNIHMIGIGGISMSGIAAILQNWGFNVTGSDASDSEAVQLLLKKGIKVVIGHNIEDVRNSDVVVYSAAIKQDDPEMIEAKKLGIPTIERADFLGEITNFYDISMFFRRFKRPKYSSRGFIKTIKWKLQSWK